MPVTASRLDAKDRQAAGGQHRISPSRTPRRPAWRELPSGVALTPTSEGDQYAVHEFLKQAVQKPTDEEFASQLERPGYSPEQRLVLHAGGRIVGHLLTTWRELSFGPGVRLPAVDLSDLCIAAAWRGRGCGTALVQHAISAAHGAGAVMATLRTKSPGFYQRLGWSLGPKITWSSACPRDVLSLLSATTSAASLHVRVWRQVEQAALQRLHEQACQRQYGLTVRDDELWRWLASRNVFDRVYVAVDSSPVVSDAAEDSIVAFGVVRGGRMIECASEEGRDDAILELLRRVCYDAIESGETEVRCDTPLDSPLHSLLLDSGGRCFHVEADRGLVNLIHIPSAAAFLETISGELDRRATAAQLSRPSELGLAVAACGKTEKVRIALAKKTTQIVPGKVGRSYLSGDEQIVQQLLTGRVSLTDAMGEGRLEASTQTAVELGAALFPELNIHRCVADDLVGK